MILENINVLYVEDDREFNSQFIELLSGFVNEVISAFDGEEGLAMYKKHKPDIVVTDIQMPMMDGLEMSQKIKEIDQYQQIIVLSAYDTREFFSKSIEIGINGYVFKPINFKKFLEQLKISARVVDIEKKNQENQKKLKESEDYLNKIFNASKDIVVVSDGNRIEKANSEFFEFLSFEDIDAFKAKYDCICDLFEQKEGYVFGKTISGQNWTEYIVSNSNIYHKAIIKKDNEENTFGINVTKMLIDGKNKYIVTLTNITLLISQQRQLKQQESLLVSQSKQAAVGELIGMIAHQWKQPLSVISMTANNMIADYELGMASTKECKEYFKSVQEQVDYLAQTIDNFRDFLKPNREKNTQSISSILNVVVSIIGKALYNNEIGFTNKIDKDIEITTFTKDLAQVILNILNNSKDAYIQNSIKDGKIVVSHEVKNNFVEIIIADNAGGVDQSILDKIYDPYFTTKDKDKGTGIGLYMCKDIIENHINGKIISFNNDKNGLTTIISIPLG